ncbi:unnamed protein product [Cylicocyclus nassatus]|uniref:Uncharacterized protein n=1 Tax=Cylicocyclus nassatus TaxID=53992 RepID=A0AA36MF76_CYLNA|nr:unnamed protein product [Cylicocyclus nassatus]
MCDATLLHCHHFQRPGVLHHEYDSSEELDAHTEMVAPNVDARIVERQDSLARAATLQEYITQATGVPSEETDLDDYELQKWSILIKMIKRTRTTAMIHSLMNIKFPNSGFGRSSNIITQIS